jgi:leucyl/phenylalanyl-tRNA---protein transferase
MGLRPAEPPPSRWSFPSPEVADEHGLVCAGGDLEPGTLLQAYRNGLFPMPLHGTIGWWSPEPRGVLPLDRIRVTRSLRRSCRRFEVRIDGAFSEVVHACADPCRPHGWIDAGIVEAYEHLHGLGWAHSVETWSQGELVGGLYGVAIGGFFAGESMFHRRPDASKVALVALVEGLRTTGGRLLDVQWATPHLVTLGAVEIDRARYLKLVREAVSLPVAGLWSGRGDWDRG